MNGMWQVGVVRWVSLMLLWVALIGTHSAALLVGAIAAALATWVSLKLLPPDRSGLRLLALMGLLPRFLWQSLKAGWDVARRALDPRLPIAPGFVTFTCPYRGVHARDTFAAISSLLPGTVPCGESEDGLEIHCLDVGQPVVAQLTDEAQRMAHALGEDGHG